MNGEFMTRQGLPTGQMQEETKELLDEEISIVPLPWTPSKKTN